MFLDEDEMRLEFSVEKDDECSVCGQNGVGIQIKIGYTNADFVCSDCIDDYFKSAEAIMNKKVGDNGELFNKLEDNKELMSDIRDLATSDWTFYSDIFDKLTEVYNTLFPNGITSGRPVKVGKTEVKGYKGNKVKVGGSGIGYIPKYSHSTRARYPDRAEQIRIASDLWKRILPEISNYQDRSEKFKKFFSELEEVSQELEYDLLNYHNELQYSETFNETMRFRGESSDTLVVRPRQNYSRAGVYFQHDKYNDIPIDPPENHIQQWLDLLPNIKSVYEMAKEKNGKVLEKQNKIIDRVESAVEQWYVANSISF